MKPIITIILAIVAMTVQGQVKCRVEGTLSNKELGSTVIVRPVGVDIRISNNYVTAKVDDNGHFACEVSANQMALYDVSMNEERKNGSWHFVNFLIENNATVSLSYDGKRWKVISGGEEQTKQLKMDAEAERLFRARFDAIEKQRDAELRPLADELIKQGKQPMEDSAFAKRFNELNDQYKKILDERDVWEIDYYKKNPMLYPLYDIAEKLLNTLEIYDERNAKLTALYHNVFENYHPDNPIHSIIRMREAGWKLKPGKPYIDFEVETIDGKRINIEPLYRGKVAVIDFWGSWCGPCRRHNIALIPVYEKYKDKGFTVIGIAHEEKLSDMTRAAEKDGYQWQNFIDLNDELKIWQKNGLGLGGGGMFLVDSKGVILSTSTDATELEPLIRKALGLE
ncbi:MAG: TlpA family protein disulfide reductase [Bacteroidales bacterium]|nr:TlpA family protein disulfide reductase [Bacteroidales bacterium]